VRICSKCRVEKPLTSYYTSKTDCLGHQRYCKPCASRAAIDWRKESPENKAAAMAAITRWTKNNPQKKYAYQQRWNNKNKARLAALRANQKRLRMHGMRQAQPTWANTFFIREIYHLSRLRTELTGIPHDVDHIIPLKSDLVCGLHCEANLAVVPASVNRKKLNTTWPDMP
jgi:hypothetical protein